MRVVLDTGVVVSALLFPDGRVARLRDRWVHGALVPLVSSATASELIRVLAYPKFRLAREEIDAVLAAYLPFCEGVSTKGRGAAGLPRCKDPDDQKFLDLAGRGGADALVTGDRELLRLRGRTPFDILSPAEVASRLGESG